MQRRALRKLSHENSCGNSEFYTNTPSDSEQEEKDTHSASLAIKNSKSTAIPMHDSKLTATVSQEKKSTTTTGQENQSTTTTGLENQSTSQDNQSISGEDSQSQSVSRQDSSHSGVILRRGNRTINKQGSQSGAISRLNSTSSVSRSTSVRSSHPSLDQEEEISPEKRVLMRRELVQELVTTEHEYIHDLESMMQVASITSNQARQSGVDLAALLGNLKDVITASKLLLKALQRVAYESDEKLSIGAVFVAEAEKLCDVYKKYCAHHTTVVEPLISQYQAVSVNNRYLELVLEELQQHKIQLLDMRSVLIKPVQRILKYPLFLDRLTSFTSEDHPDYKCLLEAKQSVANVATMVNTHTKRMDMIKKYGHQGNESQHLMQRLSFHSIAKKRSRVKTLLTASLGLSTLTEDARMTALEADFRSILSSVKELKQRAQTLLSCVKEKHRAELTLVEGLAGVLHAEKNANNANVLNALEHSRTVAREICNNVLSAFDSTLVVSVINPLSEVSSLTVTTDRLLTKRQHKLLDYDAIQHKMDKNRDPSRTRMIEEDLLKAKSDYDALNDQLLDELPSFNSAASTILFNAFVAYISAKTALQGRLAKKFFALKQDVGNSLDMSSQRRLSACHLISQIDFVPKNHFSCLKEDTPSPIRRKKSSAADNQQTTLRRQTNNNRQTVLSKYRSRPELLFRVTEDHMSAEPLQLCAPKGTIVALLKNKDPSGSTLRWYVDDGEQKGFIKSAVLLPYQAPPSSTMNPTSFTMNPTSSTMPPPVAPHRPSRPSTLMPTAPPSIPSNPPSIPSNPPKYEDIFPEIHSVPVVPSVRSKDSNMASSSAFASSASNPRNVEEKVHGSSSTTQEQEDLPTDMYAKVENVYEEIDEDSGANNVYEDIDDADGHMDEEEAEDAEFFYALYKFGGDGANHQLSLYEGQVVMLLQGACQGAHQLPSAQQWHFVENREGEQGYVPASYLAKYS